MKRLILSRCCQFVYILAIYALAGMWMMAQQPTTPPTNPNNSTPPAAHDNFIARPASQSKTPAPSPVTANELTTIAPQQTPPIPGQRWFVLIDPGHGGADHGGYLSEKISEKDFTLQLARKLRAELQNHGISAQLLRDNDSGPSLEQRALTANSQRAGIYISLHATLAGGGVHVFTAWLPPVDPYPSPQELEQERKLGPFAHWETAQRAQLDHSHILALEICSQLKQHDIPQSCNTAAIFPFAQLSMPAILVEVSPPAPGDSVEKLVAVGYQQSIVQSIMAAITALHSRTEAVP